VPYILLALTAGITSFRWGMPMTIRSCFYPLIGDHALGFVGDVIDALSISTTTFGVCTSLGLGVGQLSAGLQFLANIGCDERKKCEEAGGTWNINTYGNDNCYAPTSSVETCKADWMKSADNQLDSYVVIIALVTTVATISVLTGLDRGIKTLSKTAFSLGLLVLLCVMFADNTWYVLNVMVQTTGYYLTYVTQVGFDCEAFQQLDFEFMNWYDGPFGGSSKPDATSMYWGSDKGQSAYGKLVAAGFDGTALEKTGTDCGNELNGCKAGFISADLGAMIGGQLAIQATTALTALSAMRMDPTSKDLAKLAFEKLHTAYGAASGIPCGTSTPTITAAWASSAAIAMGIPSAYIMPNVNAGIDAGVSATTAFCHSLSGAQLTACQTAWGALFAAPLADGSTPNGLPRCPTTTAAQVTDWGTCSSHAKTGCRTFETYWDDSNAQFMDWWTIFYWAWWITWAPFVGFFVALISRGRTVREVIIGGFIMPTLFAIFWFSVFGGLAIKMERVAEIALQVRPDVAHAQVDCSLHYGSAPATSGFSKVPITPEAKKLWEAGYVMLSCYARDEQIYYLMYPYLNLKSFLHVFLWLGLLVYFITSSDSGSMTDDIISASGLSASRIPIWQKIFWCWTEGCVAIMLIYGGVNPGDGAKSLQAASIILGLPYTLLLCIMVPSLYRALKKEAGDKDILNSYRFNTQICDIFEGFKPSGGSPVSVPTQLKNIAIGAVFPCVAVKGAYARVFPKEKFGAIMYAAGAQICWLVFIVFHALEPSTQNMSVIGWIGFIGMTLIISFTRGELRRKEKIWGSTVDDWFVGIICWPFACAQMQTHVETDGAMMAKYFASADELMDDMASFEGFKSAMKTGTQTSTASSVAEA
jgi:choline-glycine betaine transporter